MGKTLRALGLMSGTSMDGIDVALIETDGEDMLTRGPSGTHAYSETFRANLRGALADAAALADGPSTIASYSTGAVRFATFSLG
jgi:anhydro-N-acetylmuramic acid kinase